MTTRRVFNVNQLAYFCSTYNIKLKLVEDVIKFTKGPVSLHRFNLVALSLADINQYVFTEDSNFSIHPDYIKSVEEIGQLANVINKDINKKWSIKGTSIPDNLIGGFPEYAMLVSRNESLSTNWKRCKWQLCWTVLVVSKLYREQAKDLDHEINTSIQRATRGVRKIKPTQKSPNKLPPTFHKNQKLNDYLERFIHYAEEYADISWAAEITSLFKAYLDQKSLIRKSGGSRQKTSLISIINNIPDDAPDLPNTPSSSDILISPSKKSSDSIEEEGFSESELQTPRHFRINEKSAKFDFVDSVRKQVQVQRARFNAIKSKNQLLLHHWQTASPFELLQLITQIQELPHKVKDLKISSDEVRTFLLVSIWTGRSPNEVSNCRICSYKQINSWPSIKSIYWVRDKSMLAIPIDSPIYKTEFDQTLVSLPDIGGQKYQKNGIIFLQLPKQATQLLDTFSSSHKKNKLFEFDEFVLVDSANVIFNYIQINSICDLRLTLKRVNQILPHALKAVGASLAEIKLLTNQTFTHANNSLHYYHTSPGHLRQLYLNACDWLKNYISGNQLAPKLNNISDIESEYVIGARYRLSPKLAKQMSDHISNKLNSARRKYNESPLDEKDKFLCEYHNLLTYYTLKLLQFCSGYRSVCDPLENINLLDAHTGYIAISDKDDDSFSQSRIIPLTKRCIEQLEAYQIHLSALSSVTSNKKLIKHLTSLSANPDQTTLGFLFFIEDKTHNPVRVNPSFMNDYAIHQLPDNIYRHYLRTQLQHYGVSPEFISYFLGHWDIGEEPFQKYSTISPIDLAIAITPVIEKLAISAGWKVQFGLRS